MQVSLSKKKVQLNILLILGMLLCILIYTASAQMTQTLKIEDPDEVLLIQEFGGLVLCVNDTVSVMMVIPGSQRADAYQSLDIQVGDIVRMVNGQTLKSVKPLKEIYENAAIGDKLKLGILRGQKMMLVKFKKADPDELPGDMKLSVRNNSCDPDASTLIKAGLVLVAENDMITVQDILTEIIPDFKGHIPQQGDSIIKLQGMKVKSLEGFSEKYNQIKTGETVNLVLLHNGRKVNTSFKKPAEQNKQTIIHKTG
ncbi:MAG: PDZ domain-containing protein [candidate division Zixibacteria bacterium]|nr:PDZ domain-containing protein [candidate division Zixibacteria bacterium]